MGQPSSTPIERVDAPARALFEQRFVRRRRPVVLRGLTDGWKSRGWTVAELGRELGEVEVPVTRTRDGVVKIDPRRGLVADRMPLRRYLESLGSPDHEGYMTATFEQLPPDLERAVPTPDYCAAASWLARKLWVAAAGTVSSLHRDLADNLHAVLSGRKRFTLIAPSESSFVYPYGLRASLPNGSPVDPERPGDARFPLLARAHFHIAELEPGEVLYLPRGWWHHVRSLEVSLSVNFCWARPPWSLVVQGADLFKRIRGISR